MMKKILSVVLLVAATLMGLLPVTASAHGEKAQQPGLRMRTVHWFDVEMSTAKLDVGDIIVIKGSFIPSKAWPRHVASIEETAFLNIGIPGPAFVRLDSRINGGSGIRSTSFMKGELYNFEITLKARSPGRYHVHPMVNVKDAGPIIGPGLWVDVGGTQAGFENKITTLFGKEIDLETYGFANAAGWSALWALVGLAWFAYWLTKVPLVLPRFVRASELGPDRRDEMITPLDRRMGLIFLLLTLALIAGGFMYGNEKWPITTPLQTGHVDTPTLAKSVSPLTIVMGEARYRIPGRSFRVELTVTNKGDSPVQLGEFATGSLRFINSQVLQVKARDADELVAPDALRVEGGAVAPGETRTIVMFADDAMWETERMTTMISSPDAVVAGMLSFFDAKGRRFMAEISGPMIPVFNS